MEAETVYRTNSKTKLIAELVIYTIILVIGVCMLINSGSAVYIIFSIFTITLGGFLIFLNSKKLRNTDSVPLLIFSKNGLAIQKENKLISWNEITEKGTIGNSLIIMHGGENERIDLTGASSSPKNIIKLIDMYKEQYVKN